MSTLPSPLKSPVPRISHPLPAVFQNAGPETVPLSKTCCDPLTNQVPMVPLGAWYQRTSSSPSLLKSPVPLIDQPVLASVVQSKSVGVPIAVPFINQGDTCPVWPLYQRMSAKPSSLKSLRIVGLHDWELNFGLATHVPNAKSRYMSTDACKHGVLDCSTMLAAFWTP